MKKKQVFGNGCGFWVYLMFFVKPGMDEYFELTDEGYEWVS